MAFERPTNPRNQAFETQCINPAIQQKNPFDDVNLLLIGAAKTATTSLSHWLNQHPQVSAISDQETQFLISRPYYFLNQKYWIGPFPSKKIIPPNPKAIYRMDKSAEHWCSMEALAKAKFRPKNHRYVISTRDPSKQFLSLYWNYHRRAIEHRSLRNVLKCLDNHDWELGVGEDTHAYISQTAYSTFIPAWMQAFQNQLAVLRPLMETGPLEDQFSELLGWLDLPEAPISTAIQNIGGRSRAPRLHLKLQDEQWPNWHIRHYGHGFATKIGLNKPVKKLYKFALRWTSSRLHIPPTPPALLNRLNDRLKPERKFLDWLIESDMPQVL